MKKILLTLVIGVIAALGLGGVAQATVYVTPVTPTYAGGSGTGQWSEGNYHAWNDQPAQNTQVEALSYIWADGYMYATNTQNYDNTSDTTFNSNGTYFSRYMLYANGWNSYSGLVNYGCVYPGFHWFGSVAHWRSRVYLAGAWTAWSAWQWSPVSSGVYAQVCV